LNKNTTPDAMPMQQFTEQRAEELAALMEAIPAITFIAHDPQCRSITGSRAACQLLRLPPNANTSLSAPEHDRPRTFRTFKDGRELTPEELPIQKVARTGQSIHNYELTLAFEEGDQRVICGNVVPLLDEDGKPRGAVGSFMDITERKKIEEALRESEDRFHGLFMWMGEAVQLCELVLDEGGAPVDVILIDVNPAYEKQTGLSRDKVIGRRITEILPVVEKTWLVRYGEVIHTGKPLHFEEHNASVGKWFDVYASPMKGNRFAVVFSDITEHKKAEETLRKSNLDLKEALKKVEDMEQQMIQQERLSALGQMASGIAHDFNNALMPILGYSDLLLANPDLLGNREDALKMLKLVHTGAMNAVVTVRRLGEFYRPPDLSQQKPVDLFHVIQSTVALTRPKWKEEMGAKGIAIEIRTDVEPVPPVLGDTHELSQLLTNLILNAVDAMPKGGSITIRLHPLVSSKHAVLEVRDTGVGMSAEVRRRCLEPFFTTKNGRNVGLGLAASHGIVQRHKGSIEVQSEPGKGTHITVRLPLQDSPVTPVKQQEVPPSICLRLVPPLRVLFVDDEESARFMVRRFLETDGHSVTLATDGRAGLTSFKAGRFDVVILDRAMPGMSGDELAAAIKTNSPETPVIMLTGFGGMMTDLGEHPVGVDKIMCKPLTQEALRRALGAIVASGSS